MTNIATRIHTWLNGREVGADEFGNRYYCARKARLNGRERRWVVYKGRVEASKVPPEWHAWLHHTAPTPLSEAAAQPNDWQLEHLPNLTGTDNAYLPKGADPVGGTRSTSGADYEAWKP